MRPMDKMESQILETADRLSELSIVIEDFDSAKNSTTNNNKMDDSPMPEVSLYQRTQRPYSRQSSDASIRKILEEAEHRKHEFWKLIDEHTAVIENLKKIEQLENNASSICKNSPVTSAVST